jgi:hypothetical protein
LLLLNLLFMLEILLLFTSIKLLFCSLAEKRIQIFTKVLNTLTKPTKRQKTTPLLKNQVIN